METDGQKIMFVLEMLDGMVEEAENRKMVARWITELTNTLRENADNVMIPLEKPRTQILQDANRNLKNAARLLEKIK